MAICRFFLQGNCKFGDTCRNEHPSRNQTSANHNPFAPLQGASSSSSLSSLPNKDARSHPYSINPSNVKIDLLTERPEWILSSYAPGRDAPIQLFGGLPREQSFEEMRLRHYQLAAQGKQQEALQEAQALFEIAENQIKTALQDIDGAIRYVLAGENQHPNRIDICKSKGLDSQTNQNASGASQPSAFGQPSNVSTFSQVSAPATSTPFGGSSNRSTFGQPSFGQASNLTQANGVFGQPSVPTPNQNMHSGFGQPSTLGGTAQGFQTKANPFQQATAATVKNPFVTQASSSQSNPFTRNTPANSGPPANSVPPLNPFIRNESTTPGLGVQTQGPAQPSGGFGFRDDGARMQQSTAFSAPSHLQPQATAQIQKDGQGNLRSWNGKPVTYQDGKPFYRDGRGQYQKIWFPDGPPTLALLEGLPEDVYNANIQNDYEFLKANGHFNNGIVPVIPPKKQWCDWNI